MNKYQNFTKSLIMYHYLICCKLKFDLHRNNKLYVFNIHIILNLYFHKFYFKTKVYYLYAHTKIASYIITNIYFRFSLKLILKLKINIICTQKKLFIYTNKI